MFKGCSVPARTYSPLNESDVIFQYKSTDTYTDAGITPAGDTDAIQQANDLTGNGYHLIQTVGIRQPAYSASGGIQGIPAVTCDGGDSLHTAQFSPVIAGPFDIFLIAQIDVQGSNDYLFDGFTADTIGVFLRVVAGTIRYTQAQGIDNEFSDDIANFATVGGGYHLYRFKLDSANSAFSEDKESTEDTLVWQSSAPLHQMDGFSLTAKGGGLAGHTDMNWLECFAFNSIKTGTAETNIYNYIIDRYGLNVL